MEFKIKWWYNINDYVNQGGRSGYESFPDGNNNYTIAQFFPRLCVYDKRRRMAKHAILG